ncbi:AraC family transcriptional regulator [Cohnella thailandensis]|uniref:AraC family transcriptional regulator n=1 Tax=Cohnella thailandensis TaxID=557557 RepID=A0A841T8P5_9BACL|nr:AraC family transcriptional regulator [Cohnella thailandensis]MBB6638430.1 AraC family transcriptional regulator [Cohnella thailandensis]MBP1977092.1 AraC-like DNA-binding protein [Cohnella thailandensis]
MTKRKIAFYRDERLPFLEAKRCEANELAYRKHFHEEYSIGLIYEGATNAWCEGRSFRVETGNVISFPPHMLHACQPEPGADWKYKMLFIRREWLEGLERNELARLRIPFLLGDAKRARVSLHFEGTMNALENRRDPLEVESTLIELIQEVARRDEEDQAHGERLGQDLRTAKRIKEYIQDRFAERITLEELERETGISRFHLIRLFKRDVHLPPHAYQNLLRVNHAKSELAKRRPIAEIALECGFYDQSHFARTFSRIVGASPRSYSLSL